MCAPHVELTDEATEYRPDRKLAFSCRVTYLAHMPNHHNHHEHEGESLADAAKHALTDAGEQWTDMRGDIFAVLATFEKPASAYDVADLVSQRRGKRVAPNSVYRILDLFVATNLARRVESGVLSINSHSSVHVEAPFGGFKQSGLGRDLGLAAMEGYTELKNIYLTE